MTTTLNVHPGHLAGCRLLVGAAAVSVFTISTFDTDWILIPADRTGAAIEALRRRGRTVT